MNTREDTIEISEENMEEIVEILDNQDVPEQELNFNLYEEESGGHIYESIEEEVGFAADAATEPQPDDRGYDVDFDEDLPDEFFEAFNDAPGG